MPRHPLSERPDLSNELIHFIRQPSLEQGFQVLRRIIAERRLLGGTGFIKGGYRCVCFTEAPLDNIAEIFWHSLEVDLKYMPLGVIVPKRWLFERNGRPVIYQPDAEYHMLPESLRYRHVRYEPDAEPPIDLTWEREWRIHAEELPLDPAVCTVVVVEDRHKQILESDCEAEEDWRVASLGTAVGPIHAEQSRELFPWKVLVLGTLSPDDAVDLIANAGYSDR
jgi:hypothetical protein